MVLKLGVDSLLLDRLRRPRRDQLITRRLRNTQCRARLLTNRLNNSQYPAQLIIHQISNSRRRGLGVMCQAISMYQSAAERD